MYQDLPSLVETMMLSAGWHHERRSTVVRKRSNQEKEYRSDYQQAACDLIRNIDICFKVHPHTLVNGTTVAFKQQAPWIEPQHLLRKFSEPTHCAGWFAFCSLDRPWETESCFTASRSQIIW
ncbi:hypothetical protein VFPPC_16181 [Pochonia chlamydosporia 170]|uniref:Uncharacterized protein n=1 Tax=Pochonia chlamydosporia 170 TaxID=1380566 RepID=A0A179FGR2_METCM|nr:hypothetical protein VFPPC_16181 [Pochonia chlamydosporia 170]OAQ64239.1 hypothetical protein VFPPC_16181 [Pochonia chlamydosporia 170]